MAGWFGPCGLVRAIRQTQHRRYGREGDLRCRAGDQQARPAIFRDPGVAHGGRLRIQWHIGAPGLEDGQLRSDQINGALQQRRHTITRFHAQFDQPVRQPIGAGVQRRIGKLLPSKATATASGVRWTCCSKSV